LRPCCCFASCEPVGRGVAIAALGLVATLPSLVDRLLTSRLSGFAATLVLPTAAVAVEYATSFGPFGTWGSVAYIQQHLPLLRPTSNGLLLATGPLGRTRARANHFTTQAHVQVAYLPADGTATLYATLGDVVAWGCTLGLLLLVGGAHTRSWRAVVRMSAHADAS